MDSPLLYDAALTKLIFGRSAGNCNHKYIRWSMSQCDFELKAPFFFVWQLTLHRMQWSWCCWCCPPVWYTRHRFSPTPLYSSWSTGENIQDFQNILHGPHVTKNPTFLKGCPEKAWRWETGANQSNPALVPLKLHCILIASNIFH